MTKITDKKVAKLLSLAAVMSLAITAISTQQASAFSLTDNTESKIQKIFLIVSDEPADCDSIGQWDQLNKKCIIDSKTTIGVNDKVIVQSNAVLEIPKKVTITLYGTIENNGTVNLHGIIFNHGIIENFGEVNNGGLLNNYWGKIANNPGGSTSSSVIFWPVNIF